MIAVRSLFRDSRVVSSQIGEVGRQVEDVVSGGRLLMVLSLSAYIISSLYACVCLLLVAMYGEMTVSNERTLLVVCNPCRAKRNELILHILQETGLLLQHQSQTAERQTTAYSPAPVRKTVR